MKCSYHNDRNAEFICSECGKPLCRECTTGVGGRNVCLACAYKTSGQSVPQYSVPQHNNYQYRKKDGVNGFLFLIFLLVPGLRHMYLGIMKRGLHFLVAFFGIIGFGAFFGNGLEGLLFSIAAIVWFYSAFDSYQLRKMAARGEETEDRPLFGEYGFEEIKQYLGRRKYLVGTVAIILGVYLLLKRIRWYIGGFFISNVIQSAVFRAIDFTFDAMIPLALIVGGVYLLNKVKKSGNADETYNILPEECADEQ